MKYKIPSEFKIIRLRECPAFSMANSPADCITYWNEHIRSADWFSSDREHLVVILANTRLRIIGHHLVSVGGLNETSFHPREALRPAIMHAAFCFILMHNHPSGDPAPSQADQSVTRQLRDAANLMKINFIDHIIKGDSEGGAPYYSFREAGLL